MILPIQSKPVLRTANLGASSSTVNPSGLCQLGCSVLPEPAKSICLAAC